MKQKIFTITFLFLLSMTFSFASDENMNTNKEIQKEKVENKKLMPDERENIATIPMKIKETKRNSAKRFFKRNKDKILKKLQENDLLSPLGVNALVIIGFLIFLPGLILTLIGVALIPALVLVLVGGTLWIIGLMKMMR